MSFLKQIAYKLPVAIRRELKRIYYMRKISNNTFQSDEAEFAISGSFIKPGDCVLDIGANVGHYTKKFSELVGKYGRVIAFEPVPSTFGYLASNAQLLKHNNTTLINAAVSESAMIVNMYVPKSSSGENFYESQVVKDNNSEELTKVMSITIDSLNIPMKVSLAKIDVEGHEMSVLLGMTNLLHRDLPILIVETSSGDVINYLKSIGYEKQRLNGSPNILFRAK